MIRKFEFPNLGQVKTEIEEVEETDLVSTQFADENVMSEVGHTTQPIEIYDPNIIKITRQELDDLISKAKQAVVDEYQAKLEAASSSQCTIEKTIIDVLTRLEIELQQTVQSVIDLSYAIASKIVSVNNLKITHEEVAEIIRKKLSDININSVAKVEVKQLEVAEILRENGIEVSTNSDMLDSDYKIIWTNGFLERKTSEITLQIEKLLTDHIS